ncbi:MAG: AraC family transcriptional regulator [Clostridia bacterium]|nr:AraC family transcriptional regulator [Clostridia bacterium]
MRFNENIFHNETQNTILKTFHSSVMPVKREFTMHHHTECELSLFLSGKGTYKVKNREYSFKKGDVFLFGSDEVHCITEIEEEINLLNIHFEPSMLWENPESIELLKLFNSRNKSFSNKFCGDDFLKEAITNIEKELTCKDRCYKTKVRFQLYSALIHILRDYNYTHESNADKNTSAEQLKNAIFYINSNLNQKITLEEIAKIACMTPTYFSYIFKKYNGISPWEYITIKRVEMAIELLKSTDMTKLEIAEQCGFSSSSNFYKAFLKITGKKPGHYTKRQAHL